MDRKVLGIIFIVFGIIALVGSAAFAFVLVVVGQSIDAIRTADPEILAQAGTDAASLQQFYQQASQVMLIGWLWAVSIIISSVASIYSGVRKLKDKKK
ncbi:MAG: hypothetical protein HYW27_04195 [Candidatus Aenigmarchaeota archaeon]|nr:hypothetical protein [Candidatus Aenigmarchaeota archaeon]